MILRIWTALAGLAGAVERLTSALHDVSGQFEQGISGPPLPEGGLGAAPLSSPTLVEPPALAPPVTNGQTAMTPATKRHRPRK